MNIAITGTHGIPNRYGGFEAFADRISRLLVQMNYRVLVYTPEVHPWNKKEYFGVQLIHIPMRKWLGPMSTLEYDRLCFRDVAQRNIDVILNCGTPGAFFITKKDFPPVVTLADGLEWKRPKWNPAGKALLLRAERVAALRSRILVADHPLIQDYFRSKSGVEPVYIPYGVDLPDHKLSTTEFNKFVHSGFTTPAIKELPAYGYYLVITRLEPENHIETIIRGFIKSGTDRRLVIVGDFHTGYGRKIFNRYSRQPRVYFTGGMYEEKKLNLLRSFSNGYFHGHSVGGTNPSLLEAMAAGCRIAAHDNPFNRYVMDNLGYFFSSADQVSEIVQAWEENPGGNDQDHQQFKERLLRNYSWQHVVHKYDQIFKQLTE